MQKTTVELDRSSAKKGGLCIAHGGGHRCQVAGCASSAVAVLVAELMEVIVDVQWKGVLVVPRLGDGALCMVVENVVQLAAALAAPSA
ncbi:hypothetical protein PsorP6_010075 [Peronosclerospora sorghi]|uniref:Uncharacterized protein n=1 Tax=Peronosclerospora sorghi TaxID=230839 RepID=A0ACC0VUE9_9STRA|nr:hypothetical protein PsorP6_010075 [Peronosclerospora sorghi]